MTVERIDTLITLPPSKYVNQIPFRDIITQPATINNERARVIIQYDTITELMNVETFVKPDTVVVEKIRTITKTETTTTKQPKRFNRWRWFVAGAIAAILSILIIRVYVKAIF